MNSQGWTEDVQDRLLHDDFRLTPSSSEQRWRDVHCALRRIEELDKERGRLLRERERWLSQRDYVRRADHLESAVRRALDQYRGDDPAEVANAMMLTLRAAIVAIEEHRKHPTGDYCTYCLAHWPCADAQGE